MELLTYAAFTFAFLVGAFVVMVMASANNKLRLSAWLETSGKAQIEIHAAKQGILNEARSYQRMREAALLKEHAVDREPDPEQHNVLIVEERISQLRGTR